MEFKTQSVPNTAKCFSNLVTKDSVPKISIAACSRIQLTEWLAPVVPHGPGSVCNHTLQGIKKKKSREASQLSISQGGKEVILYFNNPCAMRTACSTRAAFKRRWLMDNLVGDFEGWPTLTGTRWCQVEVTSGSTVVDLLACSAGCRKHWLFSRLCSNDWNSFHCAS